MVAARDGTTEMEQTEMEQTEVEQTEMNIPQNTCDKRA